MTGRRDAIDLPLVPFRLNVPLLQQYLLQAQAAPAPALRPANGPGMEGGRRLTHSEKGERKVARNSWNGTSQTPEPQAMLVFPPKSTSILSG